MDRQTQLLAAAREQGLDLLALVVGANLFYLTGLPFHAGERLTIALLRTDGRGAGFVLPAMEAARVEQTSLIPFTLYPWDDSQPAREALARCVGGLGGNQARVGIESGLMRVFELRALEGAIGRAEFVDAGGVFSSLRRVKDVHELEIMQEAARMIDLSLEKLLPRIKIGMTEREVAGMWMVEILATGAEGLSFESIVASGPNAASPHHTPGDRRLAEGDLLILDGGARHKGYASDITRTVAVGKVSDQCRRIYEVVKGGNAAGRGAVMPGVTGHQIDAAARKVIEDAGYGKEFLHRTGHGLGLDVHEPPYIAPGEKFPLPIGAVFTIEPGVYVNGVAGVRIEDDVVVTQGGGRSLTEFTRELIEVG
jgi:Xaa-Pro dipeptidase